MLVLMRHGQASFGAAHYDRLSPLGVEQAAATGAFLREREARCDEICIGPRDRHRATALALIGAWGTPAAQRHDSELDEFTDNASAAAPLRAPDGAGPDDRLAQLMRRIGAWADGDLVLAGSPTLPEFRDRIGRWVRRELMGSTRATTTMAVTSAGVVAAAMCEVMDLPNAMFLPLVSQVRNASLTEIGVGRGQPVVVSFNSQAHLAPRLITVI